MGGPGQICAERNSVSPPRTIHYDRYTVAFLARPGALGRLNEEIFCGTSIEMKGDRDGKSECNKTLPIVQL